jgi:hypothetical protein
VAVRAAPAIKVIALGNGQNNKDSSHENNVWDSDTGMSLR